MTRLLYIFSTCLSATVTSFFIPRRAGFRYNNPLCSVTSNVDIDRKIGSGSYGTVHLMKENGQPIIGKRAWTKEELKTLNVSGQTAFTTERLDDRDSRCRYYWEVEEHCLKRLPPHISLPPFLGTHKDSFGRDWILFGLICDGDSPAPSLQDVMNKDYSDHQSHRENHLYFLSQALLQRNAATLVETLDVVLEQLLGALIHIHDHGIVHRDVKPANILVSKTQLVLIDFGSAADLNTAGWLKPNVGLSERVAISPVYAAPEVFIDTSTHATQFDVFSVGLLYCQLLFQFLEERVDAGFHQQLANTNWKLDEWLRNELQSKVRPTGIAEALEILQMRPGLWNLLQKMLEPDPRDRISARNALEHFTAVRSGSMEPEVDGSYLYEVLESFEQCSAAITPTSRPLQFVATFQRSKPLGLLLAESDIEHDQPDWSRATQDALPGEVFVQDVVLGSQADELGIFEVGDRLQGVGELPLIQGGFERAVAMIADQPRSTKFVTLHFDRKTILHRPPSKPKSDVLDTPIRVLDQGAWSRLGRRKAQEDALILHEVHDGQRSVVLAGVLDGHLGRAASHFVRDQLPIQFSNFFFADTKSSIKDLLTQAWNQVCDEYRSGCVDGESCSAEYDPREGILQANTGSQGMPAGTTASLFAVDKGNGSIVLLNCGDSRTILFRDKELLFQSFDHKPQNEVDRFQKRREEGLDYSLPECLFNKWFIPVGDYDIALSRALEGPFATSKGIISTPDVNVLPVSGGTIALSASDGLWDVMDSAEVSQIISRLEGQGIGAGDAAKAICQMALDKGSADNVSVVVVYLQ